MLKIGSKYQNIKISDRNTKYKGYRIILKVLHNTQKSKLN